MTLLILIRRHCQQRRIAVDNEAFEMTTTLKMSRRMCPALRHAIGITAG